MCCSRRGDLERARFYIPARERATNESLNAQTLWLAARIENKLGNRAGVDEIAGATAQPLPAVARDDGDRTGGASMNEPVTAGTLTGLRSAGGMIRDARKAQGVAHRRTRGCHQGVSAQARAARGRPFRRTARRHVRARTGADGVPQPQARPPTRAGPVAAARPGHRLDQISEGINTPFRDRPGRYEPRDYWLLLASPRRLGAGPGPAGCAGLVPDACGCADELDAVRCGCPSASHSAGRPCGGAGRAAAAVVRREPAGGRNGSLRTASDGRSRGIRWCCDAGRDDGWFGTPRAVRRCNCAPKPNPGSRWWTPSPAR